ncbi:hypothetical protein T492DRAFT_1035718 [Pavlovales sp. CCMP2436]|nr:hypothetical protein T492DRAFT_1035718 [Pavlovales sp. CCMP2436]
MSTFHSIGLSLYFKTHTHTHTHNSFLYFTIFTYHLFSNCVQVNGTSSEYNITIFYVMYTPPP